MAERLNGIKHEYLAQRAESDLNFLARIGQEYDAIVSVKEGGLLFIGKGEGQIRQWHGGPAANLGVQVPADARLPRQQGQGHRIQRCESHLAR
ncbi:hypothetical protein [Phaeobacter porticola]|uniref:hypothetical protein n=1 Tax=Phaeobacter porticola TaxID=1844006 RepID=UPI0012FFA5FD|nr:hypothetical protein [Phaeobacter porticola]